MINREEVYGAFFNQVVAATASLVITAGRRFRFWTDVPPEAQPAVFQVQRDEDPVTARGTPAKWTLRPSLFIYIHSGDDPAAVQSSVLNRIIDTIESAFPQNPTTGARTVNVAWENGGIGVYDLHWERVEFFEDVVGSGGQAVAVMHASLISA